MYVELEKYGKETLKAHYECSKIPLLAAPALYILFH